jgi:hypothetical protein
MLRVASDTGWWLITHPDHARLAAAFAAHWGNAQFPPPTPRTEVLDAIRVHDDGWATRDAHPTITREGKPSAFSKELVGKYSAFEEINLADYLAVRESALTQVEASSPYAALLVSMHTYNLLTARADRSTIPPDQLPLLDDFLTRQLHRQQSLRTTIQSTQNFSPNDATDATITTNFHLLQATDNLSLLSCVNYPDPATLLHPLPTTNGPALPIHVEHLAPRTFRLTPYPLDQPLLTFDLPAKHIEGHLFTTTADLAATFLTTPLEQLTVTITA